MLEWDESDFLSCLEVLPEINDESGGGPYYIYKVTKNNIELELTVFPFEEDVRFRLFRVEENHLLFEYQILGCTLARVENTNDQEFITFLNSSDIKTTVTVYPDIQIIINEINYL